MTTEPEQLCAECESPYHDTSEHESVQYRSSDPVHAPAHYVSDRFSIECIEITRHMSFDAGNAFKYVWRHAEKNGVEDLRKAKWYLDDIKTHRSPIFNGATAAQAGSKLFASHVMPNIEPWSVYYALTCIVLGHIKQAIRYIDVKLTSIEVATKLTAEEASKNDHP